MSQRSDISTTALSCCRALRGVERSVPELAETRASILEECTYRTDVHSRGGAAAGETPQRRFAVAARRDAPISGWRERAAPALTDELTRPTGEGVPDRVGKEGERGLVGAGDGRPGAGRGDDRRVEPDRPRDAAPVGGRVAGPAQVEEDAAVQLMEHRPMLFGLAYRLLGSVHDAEDTLQDAFLRWTRVDRNQISEPRRYLTRIVTTVALDRLRQQKARRESYVGPWLPEPIPTADLAERAEQHESLSLALLHLMECLTPTQRAVYVLRTAFDMPYADIAGVLGQTAAQCRQLYHRAAAALDGAGRRAFTADRRRHHELLTAFITAAEEGRLGDLEQLLHEDATCWSDGGGRVRAARRPVQGRAKVAHFFASLYGHPGRAVRIQPIDLNGTPAAMVTLRGQPHALLLGISGHRIRSLYLVANPEKLVAAPCTSPLADERATERAPGP